MKAIVFTSDSGHTAAYAQILGKQTGLPVYSLADAKARLSKGTPIIYLGWLFANSVKGYPAAKKYFSVCAVCAVGLCDTGTAIQAVRKTNAIPAATAVFTLQGGMDKASLSKPYGFAIRMLIRVMAAKKNPTQDDKRMLYLLENDRNYVCEENTAAFMQ